MNTLGFFQAIETHLLKLGRFDQVNRHEPKNAPGNKMVAAIMSGPISGATGSGLASTTSRVEFTIRIYVNMMAQPLDGTDPDLIAATDLVINSFSGDFTLGGTIMAVDLQGMAGAPLGSTPGYISQDNVLYRVMDITLPLLVADAWAQAA
jgi:hypothetical protein